MSPWRRLTAMSASLALHAAGALLVLVIVSEETPPPVLIVDLTESVRVSAERAASASVSAATSPRLGEGARKSRPAPRATARVIVSEPGGDHEARQAPPAGARIGSSVAPAPRVVTGQVRQPEQAAGVGANFAVSLSESPATVGPRDGGIGWSRSAGAPGPGMPTASEIGRPATSVMAEAVDDQRSAPPGAGPGRVLGERAPLPGAKETGAGRAGDGQIALAVPGGATGGAAADYGPYLARLRQRIHESLRYPPAARRRALTGTVHMEIVIEPSGAVGQVSVVHSSAHPILDEAAVDAVRNLAPLPLPAGLGLKTLRVRLPVVFELR